MCNTKTKIRKPKKTSYKHLDVEDEWEKKEDSLYCLILRIYLFTFGRLVCNE